ncbi:MAG TPA: hypothetical protein VFL61_01555 [Gaiellaceae bacterium]|nr:hypothetical protein [Gaiellaceae bacterium]
MRYLAALAVVAVVVLAALFAAVHSGQASHAINSTLHYSFKNGSCTTENRVDPVTIIFWNLATTDRVNQNINAHTDLDAGASPNGQDFGYNGACLAQTVDKSSCSLIACTRFHIRGRQSTTTHATYGTTTQSTPHHEDWVNQYFSGCWPGNHAVDKGGVETQGGLPSGFDQGREHILDGFAPAGHVYEINFWGNTQEFPQCDGDLAGSNGVVYYIKISHGH